MEKMVLMLFLSAFTNILMGVAFNSIDVNTVAFIYTIRYYFTQDKDACKNDVKIELDSVVNECKTKSASVNWPKCLEKLEDFQTMVKLCPDYEMTKKGEE